MNSECNTDNNKILKLKGLRIDRKDNSNNLTKNKEYGIKDHMKLDIKSCDYMRFKNTKVLLIEFTDIEKQKDEFLNRRKIKIITTREKAEKRINDLKEEEIKNLIQEELRRKFVESIIVFYYICKNFNININKVKNFNFISVLVLCQEINDPLFLENLRLNLKNGLNGIISDIKIITVNKINKEFFKKI